MAHANSFRDLEVYVLTRKLSKSIFEISNTFQKKKLIPLRTRLGVHLDQLVLKLQRLGLRENMRNILSANYPMLTVNNKKLNIG